MTVKITKPKINVREELNDLKKPTGIAGEAMLRAETPQEQQALIGVGRRNLIINGGFDVSQRGTYTSTTSLPINTATYYLDRWKVYAFTGDTGTFQHKLDQQLPDGSYANSFLLTSTSSNLSAPLVQLVENHKVIWGKTFTLSFWYKSVGDTMYNIWNGTSQLHYLLLNTGGEWKKHENTITLKENGTYLRVEYYHNTTTFASGNYLELAQVQLELGSVATPFEHRSYGEELALCQRYFWSQVPLGSATNTGSGQHAIATGIMLSTNQVEAVVTFPVTMRASPTLIVANGTNYFAAESAGNSLDQFNTFYSFAKTPQSALLYKNGSEITGTAGQGVRITATTSNSYVYWSAEL